jgi:hypothetical protein
MHLPKKHQRNRVFLNLRVKTKDCRKKPGFWLPVQTEETGFFSQSAGENEGLSQKTRFLAARAIQAVLTEIGDANLVSTHPIESS